jgi:hypothetical protein
MVDAFGGLYAQIRKSSEIHRERLTSRTQCLSLSLNSLEKAALEDVARRMSMPLATWARYVLMREIRDLAAERREVQEAEAREELLWERLME